METVNEVPQRPDVLSGANPQTQVQQHRPPPGGGSLLSFSLPLAPVDHPHRQQSLPYPPPPRQPVNPQPLRVHGVYRDIYATYRGYYTSYSPVTTNNTPNPMPLLAHPHQYPTAANEQNGITSDTAHYQEHSKEHAYPLPRGAYMGSTPSAPGVHSLRPLPLAEKRMTTTLWEEEGTICYLVEFGDTCVARRSDNDMINGTKMLNVVGMSRGKRDGILKGIKERTVVKLGSMHLKGVWIPFFKAKGLAAKFGVLDSLFPLFEDDPEKYVYTPLVIAPEARARMETIKLTQLESRMRQSEWPITMQTSSANQPERQTAQHSTQDETDIESITSDNSSTSHQHTPFQPENSGYAGVDNYYHHHDNSNNDSNSDSNHDGDVGDGNSNKGQTTLVQEGDADGQGIQTNVSLNTSEPTQTSQLDR